ncbi:hypothetical protein [Krasilnikovia sp. MM14-A1259]|uniref:hypothetical protein n=1 Tax=Krasilnikovia sp. MM14-A1259 TaxID=3373539 RepID=UPI0037FB8A06
MVRLIPVERGGKIVWAEDAPDTCPDGHKRLVPTTAGCPECGEPIRQWPCREPGCTAPVQYDDEHVHHSRK